MEMASPGATTFLASSLLKLPYVMDAYRAGQLERIDLSRQYDIAPEMRDDNFGDLGKSPSATISLRDAAQLALKKSDNTALNVLKRYAEPQLDDSERAMSVLDVHPADIGVREDLQATQVSFK